MHRATFYRDERLVHKAYSHHLTRVMINIIAPSIPNIKRRRIAWFPTYSLDGAFLQTMTFQPFSAAPFHLRFQRIQIFEVSSKVQCWITFLLQKIENSNADEGQTHESKSRTWEWWLSWLETVCCRTNTFLTRFQRVTQSRMVGAFTISLRREEHSHTRYTKSPTTGTANKALSNLA